MNVLRQRQPVDPPVVPEPVTACHGADDLDRLAGRRQRGPEAHPVPALHHLRAADADAEQEPASGQQVQRHGRHGDERGRPRAELHDRRAEADPGRLAGQVTELGQRVLGPGLRHPYRVGAESFGVPHERGVLGGRDDRVESDLHARALRVAPWRQPASRQ
jgi:hypothetical protein